MKKLLLISVLLLSACEPTEDVTFWFAEDPVLAEEMAERGWVMDYDTLSLNGVDVFNRRQCSRCDHTEWLGPPTPGSIELAVIKEFNVDLKAAIIDRNVRFMQSVGVELDEQSTSR